MTLEHLPVSRNGDREGALTRHLWLGKQQRRTRKGPRQTNDIQVTHLICIGTKIMLYTETNHVLFPHTHTFIGRCNCVSNPFPVKPLIPRKDYPIAFFKIHESVRPQNHLVNEHRLTTKRSPIDKATKTFSKTSTFYNVSSNGFMLHTVNSCPIS